MTESADKGDQPRDAPLSVGQQRDQDQSTIAALRREVIECRRDVQHQVRNMLSVVRSIARRTVEEGETAEEYQVRLDSRLASFTNLQGQIISDPEYGVDLCTLVDNELLAFGIRVGDQAHVEGGAVRLEPKAASILGLAFHELARMAIEGGASAGLDGQIHVQWRMKPGGAGADQLEVGWKETGRQPYDGPKPDPAFGREVVEQAVAYEVGGDVQLDITADGLTCRFSLPADCLV